MPSKMGNTIKGNLISPINVEPGKADPGPTVMNNPEISPRDKDGFLSEPGKNLGKGANTP